MILGKLNITLEVIARSIGINFGPLLSDLLLQFQKLIDAPASKLAILRVHERHKNECLLVGFILFELVTIALVAIPLDYSQGNLLGFLICFECPRCSSEELTRVLV